MGSSFSTPTFGDNRYYILFIDEYTRYTSVWLLPNQNAKTCPTAYQFYQPRVDCMEYEIKWFCCDNGWGEYDDRTFWYVLAARATTYQPYPRWAHHKNGVPEYMICTITEKAQAMMIDSQVPVQFWGKAVNTTVYLHQRSRQWKPAKKKSLRWLLSTVRNAIRSAAWIWKTYTQCQW